MHQQSTIRDAVLSAMVLNMAKPVGNGWRNTGCHAFAWLEYVLGNKWGWMADVADDNDTYEAWLDRPEDVSILTVRCDVQNVVQCMDEDVVLPSEVCLRGGRDVRCYQE